MHIRRLIRCLFPVLFAALVFSSVSSSVFAEGDAPEGEKTSEEKKSEGEGEHGHDTSVPATPHVDLVLISLITFGIFLFVLKKVAWGPLVEGLDNRESKYRKLLADAQQDRDRAISMLAEYEEKLKAAQAEVDELIAKGRSDAERTKTDILSAAQQEAESTKNRALDDIGRARDQAVNELFDHMRANVIAATEQVLNRSLTDDDRSRLVDEALAQVSGS